MNAMLIAILALVVLAAASIVSGVFVLLGIGFALLAAGAVFALLAGVLTRGLTTHGE